MSEKELSLRIKSTVSSVETDKKGRLKPSFLINALLHSAICSAKELEFGYDDLKKQSIFWVLSQIKVKIHRPIMWMEEIETETWPKDNIGLLYIRDYFIRDKNQTIVAASTSNWAAISHSNHRPSKVDAANPEFFTRLKDKNALETDLQKIEKVSSGDRFDITPKYNDFDINGHVTTIRYVEWVFNSFSFDFLDENYPTAVTLNFVRELLPGNSIVILKKETGKNTYCFSAYSEDMTKNIFNAEIIF